MKHEIVKKQILIHQDIPVCIVIIAIGILFIVESFQYPIETARFPIFIASIMSVLTCLVLVGAIKKSVEMSKGTASDAAGFIKWEHLKSPLIFTVSIMIYVLGIYYVGFFSSTALFIVSFLFLQGFKNLKVALLLAVGGDLLFFLLFTVVLGVQLPTGLLF